MFIKNQDIYFRPAFLEWKLSYIPPQTCENQSDISSLEGQVQQQSCPNSTDLAGETKHSKGSHSAIKLRINALPGIYAPQKQSN